MRAACWVVSLLVVQGAVADQDRTEPSAGDSETFAALMEFVGDWQRYDGEWIDAMSLEEAGEQGEKSAEGEDDEQHDNQ